MNYSKLITILKQTTIDSSQPIPVELVRELCRLRKEINQLKQPMFTENNISVMKYWEEYKFTRLCNVDYVNYNYYIDEEVADNAVD